MKLRFISILSLLLALVSTSAPATEHSDVRIATPWPAQNTIISMLGYNPNLVATSMVAKKIPLFRQIYPAIDSVPAISYSGSHTFNPEQVIGVSAQLLFVAKDISPEQTALLNQAGVKVMKLEANSMAALTTRVQLTAQVLGPDAVEKAQRYQHYFDHNVARVRERLSGLPDGQRVRFYHSMGSPLITSGRPSLNQDWMDLAGAHNVAEHWFDGSHNRSGEVAAEKVAQADPQVIVVMNKKDAAFIKSSPQWQGISAVKNQRVYVNPQGMFWWCRETSEEALQFLWLAKTLYPERFMDIDMAQETRDFYREFFGVALTDGQIAAILAPH